MEFAKFFEKQWKLIFGLIGTAVLAGGIITFLSVRSTQKEKLAQESYFIVEKKLMELKSKKSEPSDKSKKEVIDYTQVKNELEKIISDFPGSIASQMAALHFANILIEEKNFDVALATLQKVENNNSGLMNTLIQQQIGQLLADKGKCQDAIAVWEKIIQRKQAEFIHNETKIQQALCYTELNDLKKAEEILTNLANKATNQQMSNSSSAKEAEKYLRLLQFKKASGT